MIPDIASLLAFTHREMLTAGGAGAAVVAALVAAVT